MICIVVYVSGTASPILVLILYHYKSLYVLSTLRTELAMILYLDRLRSAMIYPLDRSWLGHGADIYRINIDKQIIHNLAHLLYSNGNRSCFGHPSCDLSQDRQLSGLCPSR